MNAQTTAPLQKFKNLSPAQQQILDMQAEFMEYQFEGRLMELEQKLKKAKQQNKQFRQVIIRQNEEISHLKSISALQSGLEPSDIVSRSTATETDEDTSVVLVHQLQNQINELRRAHGITKSSSNLQLAHNESSTLRGQELLKEHEIDKIIEE